MPKRAGAFVRGLLPLGAFEESAQGVLYTRSLRVPTEGPPSALLPLSVPPVASSPLLPGASPPVVSLSWCSSRCVSFSPISLAPISVAPPPLFLPPLSSGDVRVLLSPCPSARSPMCHCFLAHLTASVSWRTRLRRFGCLEYSPFFVPISSSSRASAQAPSHVFLPACVGARCMAASLPPAAAASKSRSLSRT